MVEEVLEGDTVGIACIHQVMELNDNQRTRSHFEERLLEVRYRMLENAFKHFSNDLLDFRSRGALFSRCRYLCRLCEFFQHRAINFIICSKRHLLNKKVAHWMHIGR